MSCSSFDVRLLWARGLEDGDDELQDGLDGLLGGRVVGGVEPLFYGSVDGPCGGGGDHLGGEGGAWLVIADTLDEDAADGGDHGGFHEGFEGVVAGAVTGVDLGEVVASREDDGTGRGGTGAVEEHVALVEELVEAASDHGFVEGELVVVVVVEGGAVDGGSVGDVLDGDLVQGFCFHEVAEGSLEELAGAADSGVFYFTV